MAFSDERLNPRVRRLQAVSVLSSAGLCYNYNIQGFCAGSAVFKLRCSQLTGGLLGHIHPSISRGAAGDFSATQGYASFSGLLGLGVT